MAQEVKELVFYAPVESDPRTGTAITTPDIDLVVTRGATSGEVFIALVHTTEWQINPQTGARDDVRPGTAVHD